MSMKTRFEPENIRDIRLLVLDVDGVLTDGGVYIDQTGNEMRRFDIKDGLGVKRVARCGIVVVFISASTAEMVRHRARTLGVERVHLGVDDKLRVLQQVCRKLGVRLSQVAYMGDDLTDLPALSAVGLPCAPANAVREVRAAASFISAAPGGNGAVREICDLLSARQNEAR